MSRHLVVILDESGSMNCIKSDIIDGMNVFLHEQKQVEPQNNHLIKYTLVKFNNTVKPAKHRPLSAIPPMTHADYNPSGGTALYDAIGLTFDEMRNEKNVVAVIVTDGMENSSTRFKRQRIVELINELETNKNWKFVYLSSDLDTWEQGNAISLNNNSFTKFNSTTGMHDFYGSKQNQVIPQAQLGKHLRSTMHNKCVKDFRLSCVAPTSSSSIPKPYSGSFYS